MEPPTSLRYGYRIDAADAIVEVDEAFLQFARENDAPELTAATVLGRPIWDFVDGAEVQLLYRNLFRELRARRGEVVLPFRCDSPTVTRHMGLSLRGLPDGGIQCEGRLLRSETRSPLEALTARITRVDRAIPVCSRCSRLLVGDAWVDTQTAVVRERLFTVVPTPRLEATVCPECRGELG